MKTKYILSLLVLFLMIVFSCKKELEPQESSGVTITSTNDSASVPPVSSVASSGSIMNSSNAPSNQNGVGLNPPHGQKGHRCDIAVGAPLNSPPTKPIANSVANASSPVVSSSNTNAVVTQPGMNPPHGQKGHRCDIAVGAPLNSKLAKPIKNSVTNASSSVVSSSNTNAVVTQPGMNPPHGQKGHRCDIAVGAPLNSTPTKTVPVPAATNPEVPVILKGDSTAISPK